jgi:hypothetical protein
VKRAESYHLLVAEAVQEALCHHFGVADVRQLGYGSVDKLLQNRRSSATPAPHEEVDAASEEEDVNLDGCLPDLVHSWPALALSRSGRSLRAVHSFMGLTDRPVWLHEVGDVYLMCAHVSTEHRKLGSKLRVVPAIIISIHLPSVAEL